jgi:hypothetical protein
MRDWPDDNRRWVIVFNMQSLISPIRHMIELHDVEYNEAEFAEWYHERYNKLEGDEFVYVVSTKKMREKEAQIVKDYDESFSKEERRAKFNEWRSTHANEDM